MKVLDNITELCEERSWSEYLLAGESGLTQSTISSWYSNHTCPTIPFLEKICKAFGISLSQFFLEDKEFTITLDKVQIDYLKSFDRLEKNQKNKLLQFLKSL
ncbi:MAG: helix-turn-helix transcriptional regulator [Eubacterium sp.]|nr:helix-turn-helix transcriptional regulator [Eubacterium sp.]